jgi:hypothetical protein
VALAAFLLFSPFAWPCPMRFILGIPCPTCGLTRAVRLALHGDFSGATRMHPLWFVLVPFVACAFRKHPGRVLSAVVLAALLVVWVARFWGAWGGPAPI